ncbi:DUF3488 and transglutaminase-like domain-containing protein [Horticoccus luteus]|uniref:DUF3488 and transglutaminase-like domain-containing protein n=1 Tax=Horticoccus luteus TaxID=2862869 RepID=A0A8F9TTH2_9BACT|nr:DUF3488 and transglutaminase-like domain-containing protein [Horticoccus luteus]QYM77494.1 DUF3488 and transglutaminase-like domain-containing protein [Horticoccus luteus]
MASRRPQLDAAELQQVRWLLGGALTLLGVWPALLLDTGAEPLAVVTLLLVAAATRWPTLPGRVPRLAHAFAFPVIVTWFVLDLLLTGELLAAMVRLDLLLLLYRGVTYRQRRDDLQIVVLGLFVIVVGGVLSVSIAFAAQVLAFTACALALLFVLTLSGPGREDAGRAWTQVHWGRLARRVGAVWHWRMAVWGGALLAGLVVLAAGLFLVIPRFQLENSLFLERFITKKARTGFSDTIRFGDVTEIQEDNSAALRVDVANAQRLPAVPYWRMVVLDEYRDGTFRLSALLRRAAFERERTRMAIDGPATHGEAPWTFYLEAGVSRFLALPGDFGRVQFREPQNVRGSRELRVVALRDEPVTMTAYRVEDVNLAGWLPDEAFAQQWRAERATALVRTMRQVQLSAADQAAVQRALIASGAEAHLPVEEWSRRACAWLAREHAYSLRPTIPSGAGDPLVRWLASKEGGHCELFAGSLVVMAREAGLAARVITGFKGGGWNGYSGNFTVRNADAHAWCEVFDPARGGWLRVDPTPGGTNAGLGTDALGPVAARRIDRSWAARFDSLRVFWYRRIVSFDQTAQVETLRALKTRTQDAGRALRAWLENAGRTLRRWASAPWTPGRAGRWIGGVVALATAGWAMRRGWRAWRRGSQRGNPVRQEAGRWLARVGSIAGGREEEMAPLIGELQRLRFGPEADGPEAERTFKRARQVWRRRGARVNAA